jgi:autotransporter-associated beta strand protein
MSDMYKRARSVAHCPADATAQSLTANFGHVRFSNAGQREVPVAVKLISAVAVVFGTISSASVLHAQTTEWSSTAGGSWNTAGNWTPAIVPGGTGATVTFGNAITTTGFITLPTDVTVGTLIFDSALHPYNIGKGSPGVLTFDVSSGNALIIARPTPVGPGFSGNVIAAPIRLSDDLVVQRDAGGTALFLTGAMSGSGALIKAGPGQVQISGNNSYTGGTIIRGGSLVAFFSSAGDGLQGNVVNDASLIITAIGADRTFGGDISGSGELVKNGSAKLTLTGKNTYSGGTTVDFGLLEGSTEALQGDIVNNAAVSFLQTADGTYAGALSGSGSMDKRGAGVLSFEGIGTLAGLTSVLEGSLRLNGSISGSITVADGATLSGNGTAGAVTISSGAFIAPGNSIGTLSLASLDLAGTYNLEYRALDASAPVVSVGSGQSLRGRNHLLDPALPASDQDADLIAVSGATVLAPTAKIVLQPIGSASDFSTAQSYPWNTNQELRYQILHSAGGLSGTFVALSDGGATLDYSASPLGGEDVWLVLKGIGPVVVTGSAPAPYTVRAASEKPLCDAGVQQGETCLVIQGSYADVSMDQDGSLLGTDGHGPSGLLGFGYGVAEGLQLGVAMSVGSGETSLSDGSGTADQSRTSGILWAQWLQGAYDLRGWASYGSTSLDSTRNTALGNSAKATIDGDETELALEARYWTKLASGLQLAPVLGLSVSRYSQDAYNETGGGAENFLAQSQSFDSLEGLIGVEARWNSGQRDRVQWTAGAGWNHEFDDTSATLSGMYQGDPSQTVFTSYGPEMPRDSLDLAFSATMTLDDGSALRLGYAASLSGSATDQGVSMRWSKGF